MMHALCEFLHRTKQVYELKANGTKDSKDIQTKFHSQAKNLKEKKNSTALKCCGGHYLFIYFVAMSLRPWFWRHAVAQHRT